MVPDQYALIGAGRAEPAMKTASSTFFAVGDDDQQHYAFAGASVEFTPAASPRTTRRKPGFFR